MSIRTKNDYSNCISCKWHSKDSFMTQWNGNGNCRCSSEDNVNLILILIRHWVWGSSMRRVTGEGGSGDLLANELFPY